MITSLPDDVAGGTSPNPSAIPSALRQIATDVSGSPKSVSFVDPNERNSERRLSHAHGSGGGDASSPIATVSVLSASTDYGWEDDASSSGYAGGGGGTEDEAHAAEGKPNLYLSRLIRFYEKYNREKLSRAEQFLIAYRGDEEQLFRVLVQKYGPEPPAPSVEHTSSSSRSDTNCSEARSDTGTGGGAGGVMHYAGRLGVLPKVVTAAQGCTSVDTPYWPGNNRIGDQDLLSLLRMLRTENEELAMWYVGVLAQHPSCCSNGMTYISRTPMPQSSNDASFLGHVWTGSLANNKTVVHDGVAYARTILQCTEDCQSQGSHDRWRLSIYRSDSIPLALYRTVWDPVIEDLPLGVSQREGRTAPTGRGRRLDSQPIQPISSSSHQAMGGEGHLAPAIASLESQMTKLISVVVSFEQRLTKRLESIESRLISLERRK